jgi:hypothetical protein
MARICLKMAASALLDDIPACAFTLFTGDPDVDHR